MTRLAAAALPFAVALAACGGSDRQACPGTQVAVFRLEGHRVPAGDPALADGLDPGGLDPDPGAQDCAAAVGYPPPGSDPEKSALPPFDATFSVDPNGSAAALCKEGGVLFGQRSGDHFDVELGTAGAVLGGCAATCSAVMRLTVRGDIATSPEGEPTGFAGALVETMSAAEGADCGTCTSSSPSLLPCEARYAVTGTP